MPWKEIDIVKLKQQFINEYLGKNYSNFSILCASYGTSRPTGYKWCDSFMKGGTDNLSDRSRAPLNNHNKISDVLLICITETSNCTI